MTDSQTPGCERRKPRSGDLKPQTCNVCPDWLDRHHRLAFIVLLALGFALRGWRARYGDTCYDGFGYIMIARSILEGHLSTPYIASGIDLHFDPLYPALIALGKLITGDFFIASRAVNVIAGTLLALPVYGLARDIYGRRAGVMAAGLVLFQPFLVQLDATAFSEPCYLVAAMTGIMLLTRSLIQPGRWQAPAGAACLALASMVRTQGVSLAAATALALLAARAALPPGLAAPGFGRRVMAAAAVWLILFLPYRHLVRSATHEAQLNSKVWQEIYKKTAIFPEREWGQQERTLNLEGGRLAWLAQAEAGPAWVKANPREYIGRALRDLGYLLTTLFSWKHLWPVLAVTFLVEAWASARARSARSGFLALAVLISAGTIVSVSLFAVTVERYLVIIHALTAVVGGAGLDRIGRWGARPLARVMTPARALILSPALCLTLAALLYFTPWDREPAASLEPDYAARETAAWAAAFLDPAVPEIVMTGDPDVPAITGDYFYLLPLDTPARVARYARQQEADYILFDGGHLALMDQELGRAWLAVLNRRGLGPVALEVVAEQRFPYPDRPEIFRVVYLLKVHPAPDQDNDQISAAQIERMSAAPPPSGRRPNIILISIDTLRADRLSCYGHGRPTSPNLDLIAAHGVRFERVISQSPNTAPSHMTMMTGLYPSQHQVHIKYDGYLHRQSAVPLAPELRTAAEWLAGAGYRAAAWTGGGEVAAELGFRRGFEEWHEGLGRLTPGALDPAATWFNSDDQRPSFLFVHTYQVHDPYLPPPPYNTAYDPDYAGWVPGTWAELRARAEADDWAALHRAFWRLEPEDRDLPNPARFSDADLFHLLALYDGGIAYADAALGKFLAGLIGDGRLSNTVVIITADHGEEFKEHGGFLHEMLFRETLHVPLIMFGPGLVPPGKTISSQVRLLDIAPTLLDLAGVPAPPGMGGESLVPLLSADVPAEDRPAYSEGPYDHPGHRALRKGDYTIYDRGREGFRLYHHRRDPAEQRDLSETEPAQLGEMRKAMDDFAAAITALGPGPDPVPLPPEKIEQLKALGYVK